MTTTNEKLRSVFLAALMVFSVFAGTLALSGGAAAVTGNTSAGNSAPGASQTLTVTATVESGDAVESDGLDEIEIAFDDAAADDGFPSDNADYTVTVDGTPVSNSDFTVSEGSVIIDLDSTQTVSAGDDVVVDIAGYQNPSDLNTYDGDVTLSSDSAGSDSGATSLQVGDVDVSNLDAPAVAANGQDITVTADVTSASDGDVDIVYEATDDATGDTNNGGTITQTETFTAGETKTIQFDVNTADLPNADGTSAQDYTHGITATDADGNSDSQTASLTVGTDTNGEINIEVIDQQSDAVSDTNVALYRASNWQGSVSASGTPIRNVSTDSNGFAQFTDLAVGADEANSEDYVAVAGYEDEDFESRSTQLELFEDEQRTDSRTLRIDRVIDPAEFDLDQQNNAALADGEDQIVWDLEQVRGDFNNEPINFPTEFEIDIDNRDNIDETAVDITVDGTTYDAEDGPVTFTYDGETNGPDNPVTITATSTTPQSVEFNFTSVENRSAEDTLGIAAGYTDGVREKTFLESGEGTIQGTIQDLRNGDAIEDADAWTVEQELYDENSRTTTIDLQVVDDAVEQYDADNNPNVDASSAYIRLVDNETNEVIPTNEYDIRTVEDSTGDYPDGQVDVRQLDSLDTEDQRQGPGYYVNDRADSETITIEHTRLAPEDYVVDVSLSGENVSDQRVADSEPANFTRVTAFDANADPLTVADAEDLNTPADNLGLGPDAAVNPTANLTLANAVQRSIDSDRSDEGIPGTNYADTERFWGSETNSYGVNPGGTDVNGLFALSRLSTDFQQGEGYVVFASAPGYSLDVADANDVTENGEITYEEGQTRADFLIEPAPITPEVNITNVGLEGEEPFENQSDAARQSIPRDGEAVDIIEVETTVEGSDERVGDEVTIDLLQANNDTDGVEDTDVIGDLEDFDGEFRASADNGTVVSVDNTTITVDTTAGEEGIARVYLESDLDSESNNIEAHIRADVQGNTDYTAKEFRGQIVFRTGEMSGRVSDANDNGVAADVFTRTIQTPSGDNFAVVRNGENDFTVQRISTGGTVVSQDANVTADELRAYTFPDDEFPGVSIANSGTTNADGEPALTLYQSSPASQDYTLSDVPTVFEEPEPGEIIDRTQFEIQGVTPTGATGTSTREGTNTNRTGNANIEISEAQVGQFRVDSISPVTAAVEQGDSLTVTATITNIGDTSGTETVELQVDGTTVASETATIAPGASDDVELTVSPVNLDEGTYTHQVVTAGGSASEEGTLTVGDVGGNELPPIAQQYDANNDGEISAEELGNAGEAFTDGDITAEQLGEVGQAFTGN